MKRLTAIFLLAALPAAAADPSTEWQLLPRFADDQVFSDAEFPRHPAPGGFALTVVDGRWHLVAATLQTREARSPGTFTIDARPAGALAWLRLPGLVAGKVDTPDMRFQGVRRDLAEADLRMPFNGAAWHIERRNDMIWITDGGRRQKLGDIPRPDSAGNTAAFLLTWAGDLDRDGKLDLVTLSASDHGKAMCVWLSSQATPGHLLEPMACSEGPP